MIPQHHERTQQQLKGALGPKIFEALLDNNVVEIMLNEDGVLWVDTYQGMKVFGDMLPDQAKNVINIVSSIHECSTTRDSPDIGGEIVLKFDDAVCRYRFQGLIPPLVSSPVFAIRKPSLRVIPLSDYIEKEIISKEQAEYLREAVMAKSSILVVGGTGSGKTTLCNAILDEVAKAYPEERTAIIEDTMELQCNVKNKIQLRTSDKRSMEDLLRYCMRLRPDRIVVGEVRGKEAYSLIKAWNTGHPGGLSTIHANSAEMGLLRLQQLISEAGVPPTPEGIAEAINVIVFIQKITTGKKVGRKVKEILKLTGYEQGRGYIFDDYKS